VTLPDIAQRRTRAGSFLAALAVVGLLVVAGAGPASAHASLVRSSPADGSALAAAPTIVSLTFDENIRTPSVILVTDSDGASVVQGKTTVVDNILRRRVHIAAAGDYYAVYRVVSTDGHPVSARLSFSVGTGKPPASQGHETPATAAAHSHGSTSSGPSTRVIGMLAAVALLGGVGLLTVRRWAPNLWSSS